MSALGQKRTPRQSLNHLVGPKENRLWEGYIKCLGRFRIYDQFKPCWLLDRKRGWVCAFQSTVYVVS
jgi:hypothetical protein